MFFFFVFCFAVKSSLIRTFMTWLLVSFLFAYLWFRIKEKIPIKPIIGGSFS